MLKFKITYKDLMGYKRTTVVKATCDDVAVLKFSNEHDYSEIIDVKQE